MRQALLIGSITLIAATVAARSGVSTVSSGVSGHMTGGARSERELIDEFLQALETKDRNALRRLRVTEDEYRNVIMPGNVPPGQPPRSLPPAWRDYAWNNLDRRSAYHELRLLDEFGGRSLQVKESQFEDGETEYAGFTAYRQLRLKVQDGSGQERELRTGSIAKVDGQYKFISFIRD